MLNRATLIGNLGADPETRNTPGGKPVTNLRVATSRAWTDKATGERKQETEWHDVEVWGKPGENCAEFLRKGSKVYVEGRLKTDRWEKDGKAHSRTKIVAEQVKFLGPKLEEAEEVEEPTGQE